MSVPALGQQGLEHRLGRLLVEAMLGRGGRGAEGLFEERDAHALGAADLPQGGRGPGLALDHLGEQGQPHRDDLAVLGQTCDGLVEERLLSVVRSPSVLRQGPVGPAEGRQHLRGMARVEQIDEATCSRPSTRRISRSRMNRLAASQKSSRTITSAWTCSPSHCRRAATSSVFSSPRFAMEPLLELVQDQQHLLPGRKTRPRRSFASESTRPDRSGQVGHALRRPLSNRASVSSGGRLDVDRRTCLRQPGQQARLDQRRLAAPRGP